MVPVHDLPTFILQQHTVPGCSLFCGTFTTLQTFVYACVNRPPGPPKDSPNHLEMTAGLAFVDEWLVSTVRRVKNPTSEPGSCSCSHRGTSGLPGWCLQRLHKIAWPSYVMLDSAFICLIFKKDKASSPFALYYLSYSPSISPLDQSQLPEPWLPQPHFNRIAVFQRNFRCKKV